MRKATLALFLIVLCGWAAAQPVDSLFACRLAEEQLFDSTDDQRCIYRFSEGVRLRIHNELDSALAHYRQCLTICPDNAAAYYEMSQIFQMRDMADSAQYCLQRAVDLRPDDIEYQEALAEWYYLQKRTDEAIEAYEKLLRQRPNSDKYMYALLSLYHQPQKTLDVLRNLERVEGVSFQNSYMQIEVLNALKRYDEIEKQIRKLIKEFPHDTQYKVLLGNYFLMVGNEKKALKCYNQILAADSLDGCAYAALSHYYESKGDMKRADECMLKSLYDRRIRFEDRSSRLRSYLVSLSQSGDSAKIDSFFEQISTLYPDEEQVWLMQADYYLFAKKDRVSAIAPIRRALALNPQNDEIWQRLEYTCDSADYDCILDIANRALEYVPNSVYWHTSKVDLLFMNGRLDEALAATDIAVTIDMDNKMKSQIYTRRGDIMNELGRYGQACENYETALQLDATNRFAQNNYAYLLARSGRDLAKAEKLSSMTVKANPESYIHLDTYAFVLFMRGDYRLARFYQERALELVESAGRFVDPCYYEHYGDILFMLGEVDAAMEQWKKAAAQADVSPVLRQKIETKQYIPNLLEFDDEKTK